MSEQETLSPEEIQKRIQLMKEQCIFCKITSKQMDAKIVFEDDLCLAILDINPATKGHLLLMPKEHFMMMPMVPDETLAHLSAISYSLIDLLKTSLNPQDVMLYVANGAAAGQQSQHFMMHLIPQYEHQKTNFDLKSSSRKSNSDENIELAQKLRKALEKLNEKAIIE